MGLHDVPCGTAVRMLQVVIRMIGAETVMDVIFEDGISRNEMLTNEIISIETISVGAGGKSGGAGVRKSTL